MFRSPTDTLRQSVDSLNELKRHGTKGVKSLRLPWLFNFETLRPYYGEETVDW